MQLPEIIAAIATGPGRGGIGIVRISGPDLRALTVGLVGGALRPRHATLTTFLDAQGRPLDEGIALYFPAPHSYTGEDVLELQGHGGPVVLGLVLQRCLELGARVAQPGEFTRRAFLNDRMDLAQAEGVADLIEAATEQAARCAMRSLKGEFSFYIQLVESSLVELRLIVEAGLDFPEEEIDPADQEAIADKLGVVRSQLTGVTSAAQQGSLLREGLHIVLAGQPNVGKSSLLNRLAGEEIAIVTDIPGTTRDAIRQAIYVQGIPIHVIDTAGLRETADPVEKLGIDRAWGAIEQADLVLLVIDATAGESERDRAILSRLPAALPCLRVFNKADLVPSPAPEPDAAARRIWVSAKTGAGLDALRTALVRAAGWSGSGEGVFLARARHLEALQRARVHLERAADHLQRQELMAEELRLAQEALAGITGEFTADDLLGEIFSRFCIGK